MSVLKRYVLGLAASLVFTSMPLWASNEPAAKGPTPDEAIAQLSAGNQRFVSGNVEMPHQDQGRRCDTYANGQHPFAAVLSCADSRVPVELVFDQGIGDLFVVRVAGNVATASEIGSLEYGVEHLGVPVIVVLGHGKCGAVTAAMGPGGGEVSPSLGLVLHAISPAVERARENNPKLKGDALLNACIRTNVQQQVDGLIDKSEVIRKAMGSGKLKVVGAVYDLHGGQVTYLNAPPVSGKAEESKDALIKELEKAKPTEHDEHDEPAQPKGKPAEAVHH